MAKPKHPLNGMKSKKIPQADMLRPILDAKIESGDIELFRNHFNDPYVRIEIGKPHHYENVPLNSEKFKAWLGMKFLDVYDHIFTAASAKNIYFYLQGITILNNMNIKKIYSRVAFVNGKIYYNLSNSEYRVIEISTDGWRAIDKYPVYFENKIFMRSQTMPAKIGDINIVLSDYFGFFGIENEQQKKLFIVYVVSLFIEHISHPILIMQGPPGSAKSTRMRFILELIDPSVCELFNLSKDKKENLQVLYSHPFAFFDNVNYIDSDMSDVFCMSVKGASTEKRKLFTDADSFIIFLKNCVGINGIDIGRLNEDLLDRSLIIDVERIEDGKRLTDAEIDKNFESKKAKFLGMIFEILTKTLKFIDEIKLENPPRLADFAQWGCAISRAVWGEHETFLAAYNENIEGHFSNTLSNDFFAGMLIEFFNKKIIDKKEFLSNDLLKEVNKWAVESGFDTKTKQFPKTANILSKNINKLRHTFKELGWRIDNKRTKRGAEITIEKLPEKPKKPEKTPEPPLSEFDKEKSKDKKPPQSTESPRKRLGDCVEKHGRKVKSDIFFEMFSGEEHSVFVKDGVVENKLRDGCVVII